jgi:hypothetical protein
MQSGKCLARLAVLLAFGSAPAWAGSASPPAGAGCGCGPFVVILGEALVVLPTGADDTASLQCAIDKAGALGIEKLRLLQGTYRTGQLVASGFVGHIFGAGPSKTVVRNLPQPLYVTPVDFYLQPPGPQNPWPSLLAFVNGHFEVTDLAVRIVGVPTQGWSIFGIDPPIQALAHGVVIVGQHADASFRNVLVQGEALPEDLFGLNLINGIFYEGFIGSEPAPLAGSLTIRDAVFRRMASGTPVVNLRNADVHILRNRYEEVLYGAEVVDLDHTRYRFHGNDVSGEWYGLDQYDLCLGPSAVCGIHHSVFSVSGNSFEKNGAYLEGTLGEAVVCRLLANDFAPEVSPDVYLGEGTHDCLVVGTVDVVDLGVNNHVIP